ncbi:MAG: Rho termination factor N-terminal domain-containing protein, partial [Blastocatellia bacterium]|nr:Rho termination factor N-terminal domain-containing protein [Blastocatellia bacterium]
MPEKITNRSRNHGNNDDEIGDFEESYDSFLDIADLKEMNISKLTQIAKELDVPGATGMR